jgi:hypothetical protein
MTALRATRNTLLPLLALAAVAFAAAAFAGSAHEHDGHDAKVIRTLDLKLSAAGVDSLGLDVPVGETHIEGSDGSEVRLEVEVRCGQPVKARCTEAAQHLELASTRKGDRLAVEIKGWPKSDNDNLSVAVHVRMPRGLDLDAEMGVGEFESRGLTADLSLDLGVGEVRIQGSEESVQRVDLEVGVGEAQLRLGDRKIEGKGFIGRELDWRHGKGNAALKVECGVGEIDVRLDD